MNSALSQSEQNRAEKLLTYLPPTSKDIYNFPHQKILRKIVCYCTTLLPFSESPVNESVTVIPWSTLSYVIAPAVLLVLLSLLLLYILVTVYICDATNRKYFLILHVVLKFIGN